MSRNFELLQRLGTTIGDAVAQAQPRFAIPERSIEPAVESHPLIAAPEADAPLRELLQNLLLTNPKGPRLVLFTSTQPPSEQNPVVARAAGLLARSTARRVCILSLAEGKSSLGEYSGVDDGPGLFEALRDPYAIDQYLVPLHDRNLFLLRRGNISPQGTSREDWIQCFVHLRTRFDYVLIDAPPIANSGEVLLGAQLSDGVVLIVEANTTKRDQALDVCQKLQGAKVKVLGAVLNNRTFPIPKGLYSRL